MANKLFLRARERSSEPRSSDPTGPKALVYLLVLLAVGCGNTPHAVGMPHPDGGLVLNLPDAATPCTDAGAIDAGRATKSGCVPLKERDFMGEILPLFGSCSGEVCHEFTASGLRNTIGTVSIECCADTPLIAPGFPERSYLLDKLRGAPLCGGLRMPVDRPPLGDDQIQAISDWICEGAPTL